MNLELKVICSKMKTIKISADNIDEFENRYHNQIGNEAPFEVRVDLDTNDKFFKELVGEEVKRLNGSLSLLGQTPIEDINRLNSVFHSKYGTIFRVGG